MFTGQPMSFRIIIFRISHCHSVKVHLRPICVDVLFLTIDEDAISDLNGAELDENINLPVAAKFTILYQDSLRVLQQEG